MILDVRNPVEYKTSHLQNAILAENIKRAKRLLHDVQKHQPIVVYCSVGYRSAKLAKQLMLQGFTNVSNLEGSIFQWANEGRPVYADGKMVKVVHPYDNKWGQLLDQKYWKKPEEEK